MWSLSPKNLTVPSSDKTLPGRDQPVRLSGKHVVNGNPIVPPFPDGLEQAAFALGCFWGAERLFWLTDGVFSTAVGYIAGTTPNPTYEEVCSGRTGHTEAVLVVFDPEIVTYASLLRIFWEGHDPTQGMRQGNDVGTQYRSGIYYYSDRQHQEAAASFTQFGEALLGAGHDGITSEILAAPEFYYAEDYHQQYLARNPGGYCGLGGTGVTCAAPVAGET